MKRLKFLVSILVIISASYFLLNSTQLFEENILNGHRYWDTLRPSLKCRETYQLTATDEGTELRYAMGPLRDDNDVRHEKEGKELVEFLAGFWPVGFDAMEKLIVEKGGSGEAIES